MQRAVSILILFVLAVSFVVAPLPGFCATKRKQMACALANKNARAHETCRMHEAKAVHDGDMGHGHSCEMDGMKAASGQHDAHVKGHADAGRSCDTFIRCGCNADGSDAPASFHQTLFLVPDAVVITARQGVPMTADSAPMPLSGEPRQARKPPRV